MQCIPTFHKSKLKQELEWRFQKWAHNTNQGKHENKCIIICISLKSSLTFEALFLKAWIDIFVLSKFKILKWSFAYKSSCTQRWMENKKNAKSCDIFQFWCNFWHPSAQDCCVWMQLLFTIDYADSCHLMGLWWNMVKKCIFFHFFKT